MFLLPDLFLPLGVCLVPVFGALVGRDVDLGLALLVSRYLAAVVRLTGSGLSRGRGTGLVSRLSIRPRVRSGLLSHHADVLGLRKVVVIIDALGSWFGLLFFPLARVIGETIA